MAGGVAAGGNAVVRPGDVGTNWLAGSRPGGASSFVTGPATTPLGVGSLQFTTADGSASAQLFNQNYIGTPLANLDALGYSTYRASSSTNPDVQTIALALKVDVNGPNVTGGLATLIFEPVYQGGAIITDTWQTWDAFQGGNAVWWSNTNLANPSGPGHIACNPNDPTCTDNLFVHLSSILNAFPQATIASGVGLFVGSGWNGQFTGYGDALKIGVSGNTTTYDFEPKAGLTVTAPDVTRVAGLANPTFAPTYAGFVYGDTAASLGTLPTCATTATADSPVATYPITCTGGVSANYDITYVPGTLHITAATTAAPTVEPTEAVGGVTAAPVAAVTPPPTSADARLAGGDSTPLFALLICLAFGSLGLLSVTAQRRGIRR
jgi:hypothetical protein